MRRAIIGAGVLLIAGALLLAASGGGTTKAGPSSAASGTGTHIEISNFMFSPARLTVSPGATISVTNTDQVTHTLTASGGQFDTGAILPNQTKRFTAPMRAGTYAYICQIHQYMTGTITVRS